jgi:hypothetical protein
VAEGRRRLLMARSYIYGVIPTGQSLVFGLSDLPPRPEEVRTVACQGIGCVVSDYLGEDLASLPKEDLVRSLMAHQEVVERVMERCPVLPVKFGTFVSSEAEVRRLLEQGQGRLGQALDDLAGKVEMEVAATWDLKRVLREIGQEDEILRLKESMAGRPVADARQVQIQAGKVVRQSLDRRREKYQRRLLESLKGAALDVQPSAPLVDEMVMNVAFLIERQREANFEEEVRDLDEALEGEVSFRIIGPLPPYSFATVEVARPSAEKLDKARRLLGLGASVSQGEVKEAYRRLARQTHPDACGGDGQGDRGFVLLREAYDLLADYCRGQEDGDGGRSAERRFSLLPEDVSRTFLVNIRRATAVAV